jgi:hypothetical protein
MHLAPVYGESQQHKWLLKRFSLLSRHENAFWRNAIKKPRVYNIGRVAFLRHINISAFWLWRGVEYFDSGGRVKESHLILNSGLIYLSSLISGSHDVP